MQPSRKIKHLIVEDEHEFDSAVNENGIVGSVTIASTVRIILTFGKVAANLGRHTAKSKILSSF